MRILLLANNWVGLEVCKFLRQKKETIVGLGIHEKERQRCTKEIIQASGVSKNTIFFAKELRTSATLSHITALKPDIIIAAFWAYILKPPLLSIPPKGCINFHPGYLPYNRGVNPNVWPFIENTPAGVTLHYVDEHIDTGDIIARKKVPITLIDTAETVYDKTLAAIVDLFKKTWPSIKTGKNLRTSQKNLSEKPTFHSLRDIEKIDKIDLNKRITTRKLLNILRSRSYSDRYYAYYEENGKRLYVRVQLSYTPR